MPEDAAAHAARAEQQITSEALTIVAKAQDEADSTVKQASEAAAAKLQEAESKSSEMLREARVTASDVRTEGLELVGNLREMADSLRSNADRLLRDVQTIHSRMVAQIDRVDGGASRSPSPAARRSEPAPRTGGRDVPALSGDGEVLDVPEFIPRR